MHIVHQNADGDLAVLGVFFELGAENEFLTSVLNDESDLDLLGELDTSEYWSYMGSLTTPPCTEGLRWTVLKEVQTLDQAQLDALSAKLATSEYAKGGNNRVVMPLNNRVLYQRKMPGGTTTTASEGDYATSLLTSAMTLMAVTLLSF